MKSLAVHLPDGCITEYATGKTASHSEYSGIVKDIYTPDKTGNEIFIRFEDGASVTIGGMPYEFFEMVEKPF